MATTWMKALHKSGGSIVAALGRSTDYIENPDKTNDGELIVTYECDARTVQSDFMLSKKLYEQKTGRDQGKNDVIAYHIRQSFKPGEVTAEQALEIGRRLAMKWTKRRHQFIVAAHTNTNNPHVHIIFNSVNLSYDRKFEDFKRSAIALRRVSDQLCLECGLSIIEKPGLSKGYNRDEYLTGQKEPSLRDKLQQIIDDSLSACKTFDEFIAAMRAAGVEVKQGKNLAFKAPGQARFIRCRSLDDDYTEKAIRERLSGKRIVVPKQKTAAPKQETATPSPTPARPSMLIDIQEKIQQGYGGAYVQWAKNFNLKEASKTLIYLQTNGLDDYQLLCERTTAAKRKHNADSARIKEIELRLRDISELQKQIGTYSKTLEVYRAYKASGKSPKFYEAHTADIILHQAAKKYFDTIGLEKLPTMEKLKKEYATLAAEKKKLWQGHGADKDEMVRLLMARQTVESILGITPPPTQTQRRNDRDDR